MGHVQLLFRQTGSYCELYSNYGSLSDSKRECRRFREIFFRACEFKTDKIRESGRGAHLEVLGVKRS